MIVKVGDKTYEGIEVPIMVILTDADKDAIFDMAEGQYMYAQVGKDVMTPDECRAWMHEGLYDAAGEVAT